MPVYDDLRPQTDFDKTAYARVFPRLTNTERKRIISNLLSLKDALAASVPARRTDGNLLLASWNIKEFGHTDQRQPEAYFYMAEIISHFDLVAIQEIKSTLHDLRILMRLLGDDWRYVINDMTDGDDGNSERSGYIYNARRVEHGGLAGEISIWPKLLVDHPRPAGAPVLDRLKRAPYITGFRAGWKDFALINLHLHPGDDADDVALRREEVRMLVAALEEKKGSFWIENLVLLGDMNFYGSKDAATIDQITADAGAGGFRENSGLAGKDTNASQSDAYDRMFFTHNRYFEFVQDPATGTESGGVVNLFDMLYTDDSWRSYRATMLKQYGGKKDLDNNNAELAAYFRTHWRRNQLSDHFPIWVELVVDNSRTFLQSKREGL